MYIHDLEPKPAQEEICEVWKFCAERSRSIEIVYRDEEKKEEVLTRVHFAVNVKVYVCQMRSIKTVITLTNKHLYPIMNYIFGTNNQVYYIASSC